MAKRVRWTHRRVCSAVASRGAVAADAGGRGDEMGGGNAANVGISAIAGNGRYYVGGGRAGGAENGARGAQGGGVGGVAAGGASQSVFGGVSGGVSGGTFDGAFGGDFGGDFGSASGGVSSGVSNGVFGGVSGGAFNTASGGASDWASHGAPVGPAGGLLSALSRGAPDGAPNWLPGGPNPKFVWRQGEFLQAYAYTCFLPGERESSAFSAPRGVPSAQSAYNAQSLQGEPGGSHLYSVQQLQGAKQYYPRLYAYSQHVYSYEHLYGVDATQNAHGYYLPQQQQSHDALMATAVQTLRSEWRRNYELQALYAQIRRQARQRARERAQIARAALAIKRYLTAQAAHTTATALTANLTTKARGQVYTYKVPECAPVQKSGKFEAAPRLISADDTECARPRCLAYAGRLVFAADPSTLTSVTERQTLGIQHTQVTQHQESPLYLPSLIAGHCECLVAQARRYSTGTEASYPQQTIWQAYKAQAARHNAPRGLTRGVKKRRAKSKRASRLHFYNFKNAYSLRYRANYQRFSNFAPLPFSELSLAPHEASILISSSIAEAPTQAKWWDAFENRLLRRAMYVHGDNLSFIAKTYFYNRAQSDVADWANCLIGISFIHESHIFKGRNGCADSRQARMVNFAKLYEEYEHDFLAAWKQNARFMSLNLFYEHYYRAAVAAESSRKAARIRQYLSIICAYSKGEAYKFGVRWPISSAEMRALAAKLDAELQEHENEDVS